MKYKKMWDPEKRVLEHLQSDDEGAALDHTFEKNTKLNASVWVHIFSILEYFIFLMTKAVSFLSQNKISKNRES